MMSSAPLIYDDADDYGRLSAPDVMRHICCLMRAIFVTLRFILLLRLRRRRRLHCFLLSSISFIFLYRYLLYFAIADDALVFELCHFSDVMHAF